MNLTQSMFHSDWMKALGWTFVHSIWQIAVIGLLLFIILRLIPGRSAHIRYTISTMALWLIVVSSLSTFIAMLPAQQTVTELTGRVLLMSSAQTQSVTMQLSQWLEARMPMMLTIWLGGVGILMLRLAFSLGWVHHLRYESYPEEQLQETLNQIISRLKLKVKAGTSESYLIKSPVTIGHLKPLILFPVGIINQLSPGEVEAILTHELAHIMRRDYLSNLIQSFIETLFYYHPVTWWISRMVRTERENRADDLAISWCGDQLGYAKALMAVEELQLRKGPQLAVGFASRKGAMLARIQRILNLPYKNHNQMEKTVLLSLCSLCFLAFTLSSHTPDTSQQQLKSPLSLIPSFIEESIDTIPSKGTYRIHKKTDDQDISVEVEDGDIRELKIDGKAIDPEAYGQYDKVISELFGVMDTPNAMEGFNFSMPPMPPMPSMEQFYEYNFAIPPMPPMPEIPHMEKLELERLLQGDHMKWLGDDTHIGFWSGEGMDNMKIIADTGGNGATRIIIIEGNDTAFIHTPHPDMHIVWPEGLDVHRYMIDKDMLNSEEEIQKQWKEYAEQWRSQADTWRENQQQWKEQWRDQQQELREEQRKLRGEMGRLNESDMRWKENDHLRLYQEDQLARELNKGRQLEELGILEGHLGELYALPRLSLSEQMVADGLIKPGEEVEVQITPDKLKINGRKMSDDLHQKYLRMYERQQGVELSGNSRVEFTTKSRQRM